MPLEVGLLAGLLVVGAVAAGPTGLVAAGAMALEVRLLAAGLVVGPTAATTGALVARSAAATPRALVAHSDLPSGGVLWLTEPLAHKTREVRTIFPRPLGVCNPG
jgi:hypothetical protein